MAARSEKSFTANALMAIGAMRVMRARMASRRLAAVGLDDIFIARSASAGLNLASQFQYGIGAAAAEALWPKRTCRETPSELIERASVYG
jgi:DNA-binding LacI/PurR family transcriptional regulator